MGVSYYLFIMLHYNYCFLACHFLTVIISYALALQLILYYHLIHKNVGMLACMLYCMY